MITLIITGWRRLVGCLKLQVIFRKRTTNDQGSWKVTVKTMIKTIDWFRFDIYIYRMTYIYIEWSRVDIYLTAQSSWGVMVKTMINGCIIIKIWHVYIYNDYDSKVCARRLTSRLQRYPSTCMYSYIHADTFMHASMHASIFHPHPQCSASQHSHTHVPHSNTHIPHSNTTSLKQFEWGMCVCHMGWLRLVGSLK